MLPFLKKDKEAGVSAPIETIKRKPDDESDASMLEAMAEELIEAIHAKDKASVASTLQAIFEVCDSEPHEEGEHI